MAEKFTELVQSLIDKPVETIVVLTFLVLMSTQLIEAVTRLVIVAKARRNGSIEDAVPENQKSPMDERLTEALGTIAETFSNAQKDNRETNQRKDGMMEKQIANLTIFAQTLQQIASGLSTLEAAFTGNTGIVENIQAIAKSQETVNTRVGTMIEKVDKHMNDDEATLQQIAGDIDQIKRMMEQITVEKSTVVPLETVSVLRELAESLTLAAQKLPNCPIVQTPTLTAKEASKSSTPPKKKENATNDATDNCAQEKR